MIECDFYHWFDGGQIGDVFIPEDMRDGSYGGNPESPPVDDIDFYWHANALEINWEEIWIILRNWCNL